LTPSSFHFAYALGSMAGLFCAFIFLKVDAAIDERLIQTL
jgi:hypothetical protein